MAEIITDLTNKTKDKKFVNFVNANYTSVINKIINFIRSRGQPCTTKQISKELNIQLDFKNSEFVNLLGRSEKLKYSPDKDLFELRSKYNISNYDDLILLLKKSENGLILDEELKEA